MTCPKATHHKWMVTPFRLQKEVKIKIDMLTIYMSANRSNICSGSTISFSLTEGFISWVGGQRKNTVHCTVCKSHRGPVTCYTGAVSITVTQNEKLADGGDSSYSSSWQLWIPNFYSSSGPWMYHDGQDVWGPVKNNTGHVTSTRVYEFLSPLVHQVGVFPVQC